MSKYEKGQQIPISGIITITGVQQNKAGNFLYSTDRSAVIPEFLIERLEMKPYENPLYATESQPTQPIAPQEDKARYAVGQRVVGEYGIGTIIGISKNGVHGVEFDKLPPCGHNCKSGEFIHEKSRIKDGYCRWQEEKQLEPYAEPEKEPEPVYYNGKVVCVEAKVDFLTKGKPYTFKNGLSTDDVGDVFPFTEIRIKNVEELSERSTGKFIPYLGEA